MSEGAAAAEICDVNLVVSSVSAWLSTEMAQQTIMSSILFVRKIEVSLDNL